MKVHSFRMISAGMLLASLCVCCLAEAPPPGLKELAPIKVEPFRGPINSLIFSPDGKTLFSRDQFGTVQLWDVEKRKNIANLVTGVRQMQLSSDGKTFFSFAHDNVCLWDVASRKRTALLEPNLRKESRLASTALSADGKTLAVLYGDSKSSLFHGKTVVLWDVPSRKRIASIEEDREIAWIMLNRDGKTLAMVIDTTRARPQFGPGAKVADSKASDNLCIWDVTKGKRVRSSARGSSLDAVGGNLLVQHGPGPAELAPPRSELAKSFPIKLIDPFTGNTIPTPEWDKKDGQPAGYIVLNSTRTMLASFGPDGPVELWDMTSGKRIATFKHKEITSVFFGPQGRILFIRSFRIPGLAIYAAPSGRLLAQLDHPVNMFLALSPDGRLLAEPDFRNIKLWSIPEEWRKKDK